MRTAFTFCYFRWSGYGDCPVSLSNSLDSLSVNATDSVCYTVDVYNHFSFLPIENTLVMESNLEKIPAATLHGTVTFLVWLEKLHSSYQHRQ